VVWTHVRGQLELGGSFMYGCLDAGRDEGTPEPVCCEDERAKSLPFCDRSKAHADRAKDLVSRLTIQEVANSISMGMTTDPTAAGTGFVNQRNSAGVPRLAVPKLRFSEAAHGVLCGCLRGSADSTGCPTSFPMPIGQAASFNESLWKAVAEAISDEARGLQNGGVNGLNMFAPNSNPVRDPRWGEMTLRRFCFPTYKFTLQVEDMRPLARMHC
jgi:beta-glucosidase-like glycosyl hydrolase